MKKYNPQNFHDIKSKLPRLSIFCKMLVVMQNYLVHPDRKHSIGSKELTRREKQDKCIFTRVKEGIRKVVVSKQTVSKQFCNDK